MEKQEFLTQLQSELEGSLSAAEIREQSLREAHKIEINTWFVTTDLTFLIRGGRVSKTAAIVGTLVNLKPVLHVDNEGLLKPVGKSIGRKKSLNALVDNMGASLGDWENDTIFLGHGDCLEDAKYVAAQVKARFGIDCKIINYISPTIGAHSGPGTVALFFMGETR